MLEPFGRPDADKIPAKPFQNLSAETVAVACVCGRPVERSVAENSCHVNAFRFRMENCQVDSESGTADISGDCITFVLEHAGNGFREEVGNIRTDVLACGKRCRISGLCIGQECRKSRNTVRRVRFDR